VVASLGPYLSGVRTVGIKGTRTALWDEGAALLGTGEHYIRTLALARYGELVFLVILCGAVWFLGRRLIGEAGAALAVFSTVTTPNILAHAGLVTTEIGL